MRAILIVLICLCAGIELALSLSDWGMLDAPRLRAMAYDNFGFWPGLLKGWTANYDRQPVLMFVTYAFLHGGLAHLLFNMVTLWSLGSWVLDRVGAVGFLALYVSAMIGGALVYALLSRSAVPMVGASGALFGLAGGILAWLYVDRFTMRLGLWPVARAALLLILLNLVTWWAMDGRLAWETHLGGFITGWVAALLIDPRPRSITPEAADQ